MELTPDLRRREQSAPADLCAAEWAVWDAPGSNGKQLRAAAIERPDRPSETVGASDDGCATIAGAAPSLFVERRERLTEPFTRDASPERNLLWSLAASLAAHLCLLLALAFLSPPRPDAERSTETPVEVVVEQPPAEREPDKQKPPEAKLQQGNPPGQKVAERKAAEQKAAEQKDAAQKAEEQKAAEQKAAEQKAAEQKAAEQKAAAQKAEEQKAEEQKAAEQKAAAQKAAERKAVAQKAAERKPPPAESATPKAAARAAADAAKPAVPPHGATQGGKLANNLAGGFDSRSGPEGGLQLPFDNGPEIFRAVAVPLPTEGGDEPMSYKMIVFGLLERAKQYPESARERGASGNAVVSFTIDETGALTNVSLVRSSGDTDLDVESLALVARAAPFPTPPPDAQRAFAAEITFGLEQVE
ncbi:energy transducer TonB [Methylocella sp.]|jgi:colicin import membrane protein|uniref:energy transducer TonB n=1 Tax=Methylocella sp. TaxID=1978226 RepID=UPI003C2A6169